MWFKMMNIIVRHAFEKDLVEIVDIFNQAIQTKTSTGYLDTFTVFERKEWFISHTNKKYPLLVAEQNEKIVGWISVDPYRKGRKAFEKTGELSFFIHNDFKRKGIGSQLVQAMMKTAKELGYTTLVAIVLDKNIGSIRLLEKNTFEQWGFLPQVAEINGKILGHMYHGKKL